MIQLEDYTNLLLSAACIVYIVTNGMAALNAVVKLVTRKTYGKYRDKKVKEKQEKLLAQKEQEEKQRRLTLS